MENEELKYLFAKAARADRFMSVDERQMEGARKFKRKALGFWGSPSIKTLDEMAQLFYDTKIVSSVEEGRKLTPSIIGKKVKYSLDSNITFNEVIDGKGNIRYEIHALSFIY